ncbi:MAG TPA: ComEC/Rec2 family competence protein [Capsulimonadaceae bacterium]|nr:ComEC/Rec2 family competence protein [Capsulimonadaceae bacterium]
MARRPFLLFLSIAPVLLLMVMLPGTLRRPHHPLRFIALDVGQGDCLLVETPSDRVLLIDGGGRSDALPGAGSSDVGERVVVPFLRHEGINRVDVLILTHPHGDHVGGLPAVLRAEPVGAVLDGTRLPYPSPSYQEFLRLIKARHIPYRHAVRGMRIDFGDGVSGEILNPPADSLPYGVGDDDKTINNYSAVLRLSYSKTHFLLDGDAEEEAEANMLSAYPTSALQADVLKVGHHGSRNASSDPWLAAVQPSFGIISCGFRNSFGHPHEEALQRLAAHNIRVFRTDLDGAVTITSDGQTIQAASVLSPAADNR